MERSWTKRLTTSPSAISSALRTLTATGAPDSRMVPWNTSPIAPRPSTSWSTYLLPSERFTLVSAPELVGGHGAELGLRRGALGQTGDVVDLQLRPRDVGWVTTARVGQH